jgi:hypothetical protein
VTEAHIAAGLLESAGIPVHLHGANHVSANWLLGFAVGVRLQVPADCENDARDVLGIEVPLEDQGDVCPICGGSDVVPATTSRKVSLIITHMFQIPWPFHRDKFHCNSCKNTWVQRGTAAKPGS